MQSTQLACPYCGSTLNFGVEIAEGTPVECLICMQTFAAANLVAGPCPALAPAQERLHGIDMSGASTPAEPNTSTSAKATVSADTPTPVPTAKSATAKAKRTPHEEVLVAKAYAPALASAISEMSAPKAAHPAPPIADVGQVANLPKPPQAGSQPAPRDMASPSAATPAVPPLRKPEESAMANQVALIAVTVGLLVLLTGGIVIAAWKISAFIRTGPPDVKIADNSKSKDLDPDSEGPNTPAPVYPSNDNENEKPIPPAPLTQEEEDDLRIKIQEEVRQVLKRKAPAKAGGNELELDPIVPVNPTKQPVVGRDQQKVNAAIDKGVAYLKKSQNADGAWPGGPGVGYAAIGGLTLLECNTPAQDPAVQKAAAYVRFHTGNLNATYELSLAILFLDRLADPRDRSLIQGMALRLLAGQTESGGWSYHCNPLSPQEMYKLYTFLQSHKQPNLLDPLGDISKTQAGITVHPKRDRNKLDDPFLELGELIMMKGMEGTKPDSNSGPQKKGVIAQVDADPKNPPAAKPKPDKSAQKPVRPETLPANLRNLLVVKNQGVKKGQTKLRQAGGDNSNTQFAMLALWAARRHDVPTDQALLASYQRFMKSQNPDGGWGYRPGTAMNPNTMTNVGLLGLAFGHGAAPDLVKFNPKNPKDIIVKPALQDPAIQKGLKALSRYIGQPSLDSNKTSFPVENLYFLWSVERVAMLYDLKTIGGKDWYRWGAQVLVHNQLADGDWGSSRFPGASPPVNTCFALLFLRRSNLVQDLTNNLRLRTAISDPEK
jgi:hypothetical protein